jgi:Tol biopolymer transport system component
MRRGEYRSALGKVALAALLLAPAAMPGVAHATFPGGNGYIYFSGFDPDTPGGYDIWRVRPDGGGLRRLTHQPGAPDATGVFDPSAARNSKRIAFTVGTQATSDVWIMHADGSHREQLTTPAAVPVQGLDQMPGISPNAKRIAFMTTRDTDPMAMGLDYNIWMMRADGSDPGALLDSTGEDYFPEFTPDGQAVVMASEVTGDLDIASVTLAGAPHTSATAITGASNARETTPSVAPDGTRVAFVRYNDALRFDRQLDILSISLDGNDEQPIATDDQLNETSPAYSPNGKKIAYVKPSGIVIADADGSNPKPLKLDPDKVNSPVNLDWGADTKAPHTKITGGPEGAIRSSTARYRFKSNEPASTFECKLDGGAFRACDSPHVLHGLSHGSHVFQVRATDFAHNTDRTPAKARFRVA